MIEELKPCPFCGSDRLAIEVGEDGICHAECLNCPGRTGSCEGKGKAASAWNRRTEPPATPADEPMHYLGDGVVTCARAMRSMLHNARSLKLAPIAVWWWACAFKYVWRWPWKNGADDLRKAHDCIGRLLKEVGE